MTNSIASLLLSKGYFPRELPPAFTTSDFGKNIEYIMSSWKTNELYKVKKPQIKKAENGKKKKGSYNYDLGKSAHSEAEIISKPKRGYERRNIHITHPLPQSLLANEIGIHWKQIQKFMSKQVYSEDNIRISEESPRALKGINFTLHEEKKDYLKATSDWIVKTDITRFYPSIYTHSIAWAAYGKENVKTKKKDYDSSLCDRLDVLVRACNRNQTIGIPIGPETSRIIAEIISSQMDYEFNFMNNTIDTNSVDRLQDDWLIGTKTLEEAEKVLSDIRTIYHSYGLEINGSKTSIEHIITPKITTWILELKGFLSHKANKLSGDRLNQFLKLAIYLQVEFISEPVISYALSIIESTDFDNCDIRKIETFLLESAVISPISMDRICRIFLNINFKNRNSLSVNRISSRFISLIDSNLKRGNLYEAIWLLYALRGFNKPLSMKSICDLSENTSSSALALVLLDMKNKGSIISKLPIDAWQKKIGNSSVNSDWTWLLAYESYRKGWMLDKDNLLQSPLFKPMNEKDVIFYDPKKNIQSSKSVVSLKQRIRKGDKYEILNLFRKMRNESFNEY